MSDIGEAARASSAPTAGRMLREAREKQGLHIAALAASIKVAPKKLELLESDRLDALPDATFTRALAQTVCRALKIDPAPVLALLPPPAGHRLEQVSAGLNAPFRERPGALVQREGLSLSLGPWFWVTGLVVLAAIGVFFAPQLMRKLPSWNTDRTVAATPAGEATVATSDASAMPGESPAASAASSAASGNTAGAAEGISPPMASASAAPATVAAAAPEPSAASAASPATVAGAEAASGVLQVRASEKTWVEITDARGRALVSRMFQPGETLGVDGEAPFRLRIGNAGGTRVSFRGQPMELAAYTRDNVARFELK